MTWTQSKSTWLHVNTWQSSIITTEHLSAVFSQEYSWSIITIIISVCLALYFLERCSWHYSYSWSHCHFQRAITHRLHPLLPVKERETEFKSFCQNSFILKIHQLLIIVFESCIFSVLLNSSFRHSFEILMCITSLCFLPFWLPHRWCREFCVRKEGQWHHQRLHQRHVKRCSQ